MGGGRLHGHGHIGRLRYILAGKPGDKVSNVECCEKTTVCVQWLVYLMYKSSCKFHSGQQYIHHVLDH